MSIDIVNDLPPRVQYLALASQTEFDYPFPIFTEADLVVDIDGVTQVLSVGYTVSGVGDDTGGIVTLTTPAVGGEVITIYRSMAIERTTDFQQNGEFSSAAFNEELDRLTLVQQELKARVNRSLRFPMNSEVSDTEAELSPASSWYGKYVFVNSSGVPEPAEAVTGTTLSASTIGAALYPTTTAETAAGVTPTNYAYPPGDVRRYGATGSGDDSVAINNALLCGGLVVVPPGMVCSATNLTMSVDGTALVIAAGATLSNPTATNTLISVSGRNCSVTGMGRLLSPATFDATNSQRTYAVLWITGDDSVVSDVRIENVPRAGIHYENSTRHRVSNVRIDGNFPYASYATNDTGHVGIDYDPKTTTYADKVGVTVTGCQINSCVQGFLLANYGGAPLESGVTIAGNTFNHCWDHGVYLIGSEGGNVGQNSFVNCRIPVVVDGQSPVVTGNSLYNTEPTQSNGAASISVRDCNAAVVTGNSLYGLSAGIDVNNVSGTAIRNCVVTDNTIYRTGGDTLLSAIRLGSNTLTETSADNVITGNVIYGASFDQYNGAIQVQMKSAFYGERNVVRGNTVTLTTPGEEVYNIYMLRQNYATVADNIVSNADTAGGAKTYDMVFLSGCASVRVTGNVCLWTTGGTNITARGIRVAADCTGVLLRDNCFELTSGDLSAATNISDAGTNTYIDQVTRGVAASVADGGTITHGHPKTPTSARVTPSTSGEFVSVTALGSATITVAIKKHDNSAGTTQTLYWEVAG